MKAPETPVSLSDVTHEFDERRVLAGINLSLEKDCITAVLGKSGSGKSTLLRIINGLVRPKQGTVRVFGEPLDYNRINDLRLQIGYVVQQIGLFPHMNIRNNINLLGRIRHLAEDEVRHRVNHLLEMVKLPPAYLTKYPHELSGGEQQRVGICRAMFLNPPLLLMDEPFGSLDYETKRHIYKQLIAIQRDEPRTIILVTHDWDEAITVSDHFLWIADGQIKEQGNKNDLMELKRTIFL